MTTKNTSTAISAQSKAASQVSASLTALSIFPAAIIFLIGVRDGVQAMQALAGIALAIAIAGAVSVILCKRGHLTTGIWIIIGTICLAMPVVSLLVTGYGWLGIFSIPLLIAIISRWVLPPRQFQPAMILSVVSGGIALVLDIYGAANRPAMLNSEIIVPIIVISLFVPAILLLIRQFAHLALRTKLLTMFLLVALMPLGILTFLNSHFISSALTEAANSALSSIAAQTGEQIDTFIESNLDFIQAEAQLSIFQDLLNLTPEDINLVENTALDTMQILSNKNTAFIISYTVLDRQGQHHISYPRVDKEVPPFLGLSSVIEGSLIITMMTDIPYVSPVVIDRDTGNANIYFAGRISSDNGEPLGLLIVRYNAAFLQELIANSNEAAGESSYGILFDEYHIVLAHGITPETIFKSVVPLSLNQTTNLQILNRLPDLPVKEITIDSPDLEQNLDDIREHPVFTVEGANQVATYQLDTRPWVVAFFQPQENFLAPAKQQTRINLVLGLIIAGIVTIAATGASRSIGAPIANLTELIERIASGDLSIQVPILTHDEIGRLAATFNSMTSQIRNLLSGLESQVAERTRELERKAIQIQTAAEVARDASAAQDLDSLLNNAVDLINERFGFYHAAIFLLDEFDEYAVLRASNSEGGRQMVALSHKLKVGEVGIVGDTTQTGKPHIALDVGADAAHFAHPLLPETRSEMALPIRVGDRIIGALDIQSKEQGAFDDEDIAVLQVLADQLAVAIRNIQLLTEVQQTVGELQMAYGEYTHRTWQEWSQRAHSVSGYRYRDKIIESVVEQSPEAIKAWENEQTFTTTSEKYNTLAVPIKLRGETMGVIDLHLEGGTVSQDMPRLIDDIAESLGLALDNARLLDETRRRAAREQLTSKVTAHIRETLHIDTIIKTAADEIRQALDLPEVAISLHEPTSTKVAEE